jgi:hypothetical protein
MAADEAQEKAAWEVSKNMSRCLRRLAHTDGIINSFSKGSKLPREKSRALGL